METRIQTHMRTRISVDEPWSLVYIQRMQEYTTDVADASDTMAKMQS